jgi:hypothetical protein
MTHPHAYNPVLATADLNNPYLKRIPRSPTGISQLKIILNEATLA